MPASPTSLAPPPPPARWISYEEFLADESEEHAEWVNGEIIPMGTVSAEHSDTSALILRLFKEVNEALGLGRVFYEPFNMKTGPGLPGRCPDVLFVSSANLDRVQHNFLEGPADIAVEVVSTGSLGRDRGDKYGEYEAGGVPEYWLIDPQRRVAEFYVLDSSGRYALQQLQEGVFRSTQMEGLWVRVDWFWELPPLHQLRAELGLL